MTYQTRTREFAIQESLKKCAPLVEADGQAKWNFILNNGSMMLVTAQADDEWLHLLAPLESGLVGSDAWKLLRLNHQLGSGKFARLPGEKAAHLRAEIPLNEEVDITRRLQEACAGFKAASGSLHGEKMKEHAKLYPVIGPDDAGQERESELSRLCQESGWQFTERSATKLAVDLEVGDGFYQAMIEERPGGEVLVFVELLARDESFGEWSRRAMGAMLLRASALVRFARAAIRETDGHAAALFEASFATMPCAVELSHALSALSIACRLCGREVAAMQDERVAKHYLAAQS